MINSLNEKFSIEDYHEKPTLILSEEDVFYFKYFYSIDFADEPEYDLILEEKKWKLLI